MSARTASPTARLLRDSRFFSLPRPLAKPASSAQEISETAPTPYPIQQAIASPRSSRARGDWGLKRPLPLRSTNRSSTPALRINAIDTIEHVTDFDSAADHTQTLQKFSELHLPISVLEKKIYASKDPPARSVFEKNLDRTVKKLNNAIVPPTERWKFDGPWLAGMSQGDFFDYILRRVQPRRQEFLAYLREHLAQKTTRSSRAQTAGDAPQDPATTTANISDPEASFQDFLRNLRAAPPEIESELYTLIAQFLDLPGLPFPSPTPTSSQQRPRTANAFIDSLQAGERAPPSMHRSAGLSYLRTSATLSNHPLLGPQTEPAPIAARVLKDQLQVLGQNRPGQIGIAGFAALAPPGARFPLTSPTEEAKAQHPAQARKDERGDTVGLTVEGGNRVWVAPQLALVDEDGRAQIHAANASVPAVNVRTGDVLGPEDGVRQSPRAEPLGDMGARFAGLRQAPNLDGNGDAEGNRDGRANGRGRERMGRLDAMTSRRRS
ncbi:MAG: hypothetical protein M1828_006255 [Chrysothrix sp. TS-e1954]|nr:MAG: hypothetical protein M1828_006255 [Chrysothrix sp. TS-e1954]